MPKTKLRDVEFRYSEKGTLRPGDIFRARGGPTYKGQRVGVPGLYKMLDVEERRRRVHLVSVPVDKYGNQKGGVCILYVQGNPYRLQSLPDWVVRPYKVSKKRSKT